MEEKYGKRYKNQEYDIEKLENAYINLKNN